MGSGDLEQSVAAYLAAYPAERPYLTPLLAQLAEPAAGGDGALFSRKTLPGHIVASGIVVSGDRLLTVSHPYLQRLLQPGGHVERGETPWQAAMREVEEETGLRVKPHPHYAGKIPAPIDIDIHAIPENQKKAEPRHCHYDFRYLLAVEEGCAAQKAELRHEWLPFSAVTEPSLQRVIGKLKRSGLAR